MSNNCFITFSTDYTFADCVLPTPTNIATDRLNTTLSDFNQTLWTLWCSKNYNYSKREKFQGASMQPSYHQFFLLPVFEVWLWLLFPGPPCVTSLFPVQTLGQNNTAMSQEATGRTNTKTDGKMHPPFSNKTFHTQFLASPTKWIILNYSLLVEFYCAALPKQNKTKKKPSERTRLERHRSSGSLTED